jgi:hypothetical protein
MALPAGIVSPHMSVEFDQPIRSATRSALHIDARGAGLELAV